MSWLKKDLNKELQKCFKKLYNKKEQTQEYYACSGIYTRISNITTKLGRQANIGMQDQ